MRTGIDFQRQNEKTVNDVSWPRGALAWPAQAVVAFTASPSVGGRYPSYVLL